METVGTAVLVCEETDFRERDVTVPGKVSSVLFPVLG